MTTESRRAVPSPPVTLASSPLERPRISEPPRGLARIGWLGPGFLWMVSAAGSGELLFTPRVGALYGYALVWALLAAVILKWFINREIGRYTVCTGRSILEGFHRLPGPTDWAVWFILVPQLAVAIATIAGLAGSSATALILVLPGDVRWWTIGAILASTALVIFGRYAGVERVASAIAVILALASVVTAARVFDNPRDMAAGLVPQLPPDLRFGEILPWLGFMLSGAAGMIWYSYWIQSKGYGAARRPGRSRPREEPAERVESGLDARRLEDESRRRLHGWLGQLTLDNTIAVVGTLIITLAFLVLGAELLRPRGLVPEESRVADVLGRLLGEVWGPIGFWFMIVAVFVGFWDTVLSDQDGFGRMFANGTRILTRRLRLQAAPVWMEPENLRRLFVVLLLTVLPITLYLVRGEPVFLLKLAGVIEAAHIPVLAGLTLYLNRRELPKGLRASVPVMVVTALAAMFFAVFAALYLVQLI